LNFARPILRTTKTGWPETFMWCQSGRYFGNAVVLSPV